jgi:hypothetical protein
MNKRLIGVGAFSAISLVAALAACGKTVRNPLSISPEKDSSQVLANQRAMQAGTSSPLPSKLPPPPSPLASASPAPDASPAPFALTESYSGQNLFLAYPHPASFGFISLQDEDAKQFYDVLAVKTRTDEGNLVWENAKVRQGENISCFEQALKTSPTKPQYSCSLYIDYSRGSVLTQPGTVEPDASRPELKSGYLGKNLALLAGKEPSSVFLEGDDARALYFSLSVSPVVADANGDYLPANVKNGKDIRCVEQTRRDQPDARQYSCTIQLSYRRGEVAALSR